MQHYVNKNQVNILQIKGISRRCILLKLVLHKTVMSEAVADDLKPRGPGEKEARKPGADARPSSARISMMSSRASKGGAA
jgi:hypothetical protein